jgi:hypothetical protein
MAKKCIPGLFCVENMTLFIVFVILVLFIYAYYVLVIKPKSQQSFQQSFVRPNPADGSGSRNNNGNSILQGSPVASSSSIQTPIVLFSAPLQIPDSLQSVYIPPVKVDQPYPPASERGLVRGLPINMSTQGPITNYSQIGILTRLNGSGDMVLPLMGRQTPVGRGKYQYYTMMPSGNLNTKLPVSVNGKSCTSEYGCDEVSSGDIVYVDGINDTFRATIYESGLFSYIPY